MNDHDPENLPAVDRKPKTSQATIAMPNGSHQQRGQHTRGTPPSHALAPLCAKPILDTGACLIDAGFDFSTGRKFLPCAIPCSDITGAAISTSSRLVVTGADRTWGQFVHAIDL
jgi:hypothetical protein